MGYKLFCKALFRVAHLWCVHIHKDEYLDFLRLIYNRITKIVKYNSEGKETVFDGDIKIYFYDVIKADDFEKMTWENAQPEEEEDELYDYQDVTDSLNTMKKKRPALDEALIPKQDIIIYSEETVFDESSTQLNELESSNRVLINDEDIVIYGYPTQYILTYFKNNIEEFKNLLKTKANNYVFKIPNKKNSEHLVFEVKFEKLDKIVELITSSKDIILRRDFFHINNEIAFGRDFIDEDIAVLNNFQRNAVLDRRLLFQEILSIFFSLT